MTELSLLGLIWHFNFTYMQLIKVWRWRWKVRLLRLEGFPDFPNSSQDPVARVQEALLWAWSLGEKDFLSVIGEIVFYKCIQNIKKKKEKTWILDVSCHGFSSHNHGWDCSTKFIWSSFDQFSEFRVLWVLHFPLATRRTRLARRAMLVAPATNIWGWTLAIATRHLSMSFLMASSDASKRDFVSMASSTRPEIKILNIWKNFKIFYVVFYVIWVFAYWSFFQCCQSIGSSWSQSVHMQPGCQGSSAKYVQQKWPAHEYSKR